ncbi:MAG: FHA domain-containing protein [Actinobacteria bacterium]|nr:MAG: FHA domain-containing protein [Actinomycetota bacterium]
MRFGVSHVLDAIERRITTDPTAAGGVVDLTEIVRLADLDGGRPAHLLRLGLVIDALARHMSDGGVAVYPVAQRALLSDTDLTANERMVIRRWSDDGKVEVLRMGGPPAIQRIREVAALTGLPLLSRQPGGYPGLTYAPVPTANGPALSPQQLGPGPAAPAAALGRKWRCPEPGCASFGPPGAREPDPFGPQSDEPPGEPGSQPPPQLVNGVPQCPRHGAPLRDTGPVPRAVTVVIRVKGVAWHRLVVTEAAPVTVGRSPEEPGGVGIGLALDERGLRWVSRSHVRLELHGSALQVTDTSTNGTTVLLRTGPVESVRRAPLVRGEGTTLGEWDTVELYEGVELARADRAAGPIAGAPTNSVMADAPTQAIRLS